DGLRAATCEKARRGFRRIEELGRPSDDFRLDFAQRRECLGIEGVLVEIEHCGALRGLVRALSPAIDHAEGLAVLPARGAFALLCQIGNHVLDGPSDIRKCHEIAPCRVQRASWQVPPIVYNDGAAQRALRGSLAGSRYSVPRGPNP